jgi:hypothetical protein
VEGSGIGHPTASLRPAVQSLGGTRHSALQRQHRATQQPAEIRATSAPEAHFCIATSAGALIAPSESCGLDERRARAPPRGLRALPHAEARARCRGGETSGRRPLRSRHHRGRRLLLGEQCATPSDGAGERLLARRRLAPPGRRVPLRRETRRLVDRIGDAAARAQTEQHCDDGRTLLHPQEGAVRPECRSSSAAAASTSVVQTPVIGRKGHRGRPGAAAPTGRLLRSRSRTALSTGSCLARAFVVVHCGAGGVTGCLGGRLR